MKGTVISTERILPKNGTLESQAGIVAGPRSLTSSGFFTHAVRRGLRDSESDGVESVAL